MTALLERAIDRIKELSEAEQDILAAFILEKLEADWDKQIEKDFASNGELSWLLEEAETEIENSFSKESGFDCL